MKSNRIKFVVVGLSLALAAAISLAQSAEEMHHPHGQGAGFGFEGRALAFVTQHLQLTDTQQAQMKQIFAAQKPTILPLIQQLAQNRQQLNALAQSGSFDEEKVRVVASQQAQLTTELEVAKTRAMSEIFNILTPEQKAKAVEFMDRREARMAQHLNQSPHTEQP